jgi:pilus assembly protein CpaC
MILANNFQASRGRPANRPRPRRRMPGTILFIALFVGTTTAVGLPGGLFGIANTAQARGGLVVEVSKGRIVRLDKPAKTVFVADPTIADVQVKSSKLIYLFGRKVGETTLIAVDSDDKVLLNVGVSVNHNLSRMRRALNAVLPKNHIRLRSIDGAVLLTGQVQSQREATKAQEVAARFVQDEKKNVVNQISVVGPNQVNLRVRVLEVNKETLKRIGINWDAIIRTGSFVIGVATGVSTATVVNNTLTSAFNLRNGGTFTNNNVGVNYRSNTADINALVDLLDREGLIKILAEPNLSAMSGKKASFLAGGEFPVPVPQADGVVTIEYKKFGVGLSFTPIIESSGRIKMLVAPEVSNLTNTGAIRLNNITVPALQTRRAETMVEVSSGQSIVIGGLLQNNVTKEIRKVPWLGDIPVLGKLFTSQEFQRNETELVIIATPFLVKPFNHNKYADASKPRRKADNARVVRGTKHNAPAARTVSAPRRLNGPTGFVLE